MGRQEERDNGILLNVKGKNFYFFYKNRRVFVLDIFNLS